MTKEQIRRIIRRAEHKYKYINWNQEASKVNLDEQQYHDLLEEFLSNPKYERISSLVSDDGVVLYNTGKRTVREAFKDNCFEIYTPRSKRVKYHRIYCRIDGEYIIYQYRKDGKEDHTDIDPVAEVEAKFKERTGCSLRKAFSSSPYELRDIIPAPLYYLNNKHRSYSHSIKKLLVHSIDGCSQYPTAACDLLPTANHSKTVQGRVEPNEEYPFAFYLNSKHIAVYNEFDTHNWLKSHYAESIIYRDEDDPNKYQRVKNFKDEDEVTLLMKASDYTLKEEMEYWFMVKESYPKGSAEREMAKHILNALIGNFHRKKKSGYYSYADLPLNHVAAVIIARANNRMIERINKIIPERLIHVCVDGIIFKGKQIFTDVVDSKHRALGKFELEYTNCQAAFMGINQYIIVDKVPKVCHTGLTYFKGTKIDNCTEYHFEDMFEWYKLANDEDYYKFVQYRKRKI